MSITKALLLALWAGYCSFDDQGPQMLRRPLLISPVVGLIMGDLTTSLVIGGTLELMWMGLGNMAGYTTPDMILGTIVGTTFAISSGDGNIATGVALATTVAVLAQQLLYALGFIRQFFAPWADRLAESGNFDSLLQIQFAGAMFQFLARAIPAFLVVYLGSGIVDRLMAAIPSNVLAALNTASGVLPAVGLSILMTIIMKKGMWAFLILGFVLNAYLGLNTMSVTLISLAFGTIYVWIMQAKEGKKAAPASQTDEEGEYDL